MGLSRRSLLGSVTGLAAAGLVTADQLVARPAYALDPDGMESKMLFGDAHAGAAAVPLPSGNGNYHSIRIPAIIAIPGTSVVVAVAEGRPYDVKDNSGNFNLLYRRSTDSGVTWSAAKGLVGVSDDSWGNGTLVYDPDRNELCCFMLRKRAEDLEVDPAVYIMTSTDRGATWSSPVARPDLERNRGDNDFIGPGNGIRRSTDGTLFVPAKGRLIYRPPGGDWQTSQLPHGITTGAVYGEGTVAERGDGKLILNYRATDAEHQADASRRVAIGHPGNWELLDNAKYWRAQIIDSWAHAAQISHTVDGSRRLIFLNSASRTRWNRYAMKLRASTDDGETWATYGRLLSDDPLANEGNSVGDLREGGYSALASTGSGIVYALVEARRVQVANPSIDSLNNSPCAVVLRRFAPSWITVQA